MMLLRCCSSGTTQGKPKYLPFNHDLVGNTMQVYKTSFAFRNRYSFNLIFEYLGIYNFVLTLCLFLDQRISDREGEGAAVHLQQQAIQDERWSPRRDGHHSSLPGPGLQEDAAGDAEAVLQPRRGHLRRRLPPVLVLPPPLRPHLPPPHPAHLLHIRPQHRPRLPHIRAPLAAPRLRHPRRRAQRPNHLHPHASCHGQAAQARPRPS